MFTLMGRPLPESGALLPPDLEVDKPSDFVGNAEPLPHSLATPSCQSSMENDHSKQETVPPHPTVNILIVDDEPRNLLALEAVLAGVAVKMRKARSGLEALKYVLHEDFALILMDVKMPGMDGFETAALIRQRKQAQYIPIIFLTAYAVAEVQMFKGYALGAVDYLSKPIVPEVLRSKVGVFVEMFLRAAEIKQQAELLRQIEQREHQRQLAEAQARWESERLREEIRIARQIQQKLFPVAPLPLLGIDIGGASYPAEATGGDYFDYIPMQGGALGLVVGDVAGHGFGPALLMAETRAYLRAFVMTHTDVGEIVSLVNRALVNDTPDDRFTTLVLARLDPRDRSFCYTSAGHVTGYLLDASGAIREALVSTGMPLGILPDAEFPAAPPLKLHPGELVVLLTDGIVEAFSPDEVPFGAARVIETIRANWGRSARETVDSLYRAVRDFCGNRASLDDMTAIVIKVEA
jgi:serine phosphatase RsbU (regulator of sigma subunit)